MTTIDDDKLLTVAQAMEAFGLPRNVWLKALRGRDIPSSKPKGPTGWLVRASDAREYARKFFDKTKIDATTEEGK